jgi:hypothetical protein
MYETVFQYFHFYSYIRCSLLLIHWQLSNSKLNQSSPFFADVPQLILIPHIHYLCAYAIVKITHRQHLASGNLFLMHSNRFRVIQKTSLPIKNNSNNKAESSKNTNSGSNNKTELIRMKCCILRNEHIPSWKICSQSTSHDIVYILCNLNVASVFKEPATSPVLSKIDPVHSSIPYLGHILIWPSLRQGLGRRLRLQICDIEGNITMTVQLILMMVVIWVLGV